MIFFTYISFSMLTQDNETLKSDTVTDTKKKWIHGWGGVGGGGFTIIIIIHH